MAKTIEQLKAQGAEVKNATLVGENTATRVGTLFTDIVEHVEQYEAGQTADTEANALAISNEAQARAKADEQMNTAIVAEKNRAEAAEQANATAINAADTKNEEQDQKLSEVEVKTSDISKEVIDTTDDFVSIEDNNGNEVCHIDENGLDAKNVKSNGKNVLTEHQDISGLATKDEVAKKQDKIEQISEEVSENVIESIDIYNDEETEHLCHIGKDGANFKSLNSDGIPVKTAICEVVNFTLESGYFYKQGEDVYDVTMIRTPIINTNGEVYLVTCPKNMQIGFNIHYKGYDREYIYQYGNGIVFKNTEGFIRFNWKRINEDASNLLETLTEEERNGIKVYKILPSSAEYDIIIAASNSSESDKRSADIVCDGENDTRILAAAFCPYGHVKVKLMDGVYNINEAHYTKNSNEYASICTPDFNCCTPAALDGYPPVRSYVDVHGSDAVNIAQVNNVILKLSHSLYESIPTEAELSIILTPTKENQLSRKIKPYHTFVRMSGVNVMGAGYTKKVVHINLKNARVSAIDRCSVSGISDRDVETFSTKPVEGNIGIRVGFGSNSGSCNYVKNLWIFNVNTAVSCAGEHYIFENVLVHHCYNGFAFGDYPTVGHFEHPNIMIGCSIESTYRLMYLTKMGIDTPQDYVMDSDNNIIQSTIICDGLSTEMRWHKPIDERADPSIDETSKTLGIYEVIKGAYRGRIAGDAVYADVDSCKKIEIKNYIAYEN